MTSAARPTFHPVIGGHGARDTNIAPIRQYNVRAMPAHQVLKKRLFGDNSEVEERERDLKRELEEAEKEYFENRKAQKMRKLAGGSGENHTDSGGDGGGGNDSDKEKAVGEDDEEEMKRRVLEKAAAIDQVSSSSEEESSDSSESEDDDDEDDTAELLRELEKIKKERAAEKERLERERLEQEQQEKEANALAGNPLLATSSSFTIKRRWDDDVVFKNQAQTSQKKQDKQFVNDLLRSDFHRKFMNKYIK